MRRSRFQWSLAAICVLTQAFAARAQLIDVSESIVIETGHIDGYLGQGVSTADFNGDLIDDLSFGSFSGELRFYAGAGDGTFYEVFLNIPGLQSADAKMVLWVDVDNDGDNDLFATYRLAPNKLWLNEGDGNFVDVSESVGLRQDSQRSYGASFGDVDGNGFVDCFVANYSGYNDLNPVNELYLNLGPDSMGDLHWLDFGEACGFDTLPAHQSFQGQWVDFDLDGGLDLHVIRDRFVFSNFYFEFSDDMIPTDIALESGLDLAINCMTTSVADYDCDLDEDLYLTAFPSDSNWLMINEQGVFNAMASDGSFPMDFVQTNGTSWAANWLDVDNNGWEDLHVTTGSTLLTSLLMQEGFIPTLNLDYSDKFFFNSGGVFTPSTAELFDSEINYSFSTATGDFNLDGFPDLISNRVGPHAQVLQASQSQMNWVKLMLSGGQSNRNAIGSHIFVWSGEHQQMRTVYAGENYLGQNSWWQHFGMNDYDHIDSLAVQWPSGLYQTIYGIDVNAHYTLEEGGELVTVFPDPQEGCTYPDACNFDSAATLDDGSCHFDCDHSEICGEGTAWDESSGQCVWLIPCCEGDINLDGHYDVLDLLFFLLLYGQPCE